MCCQESGKGQIGFMFYYLDWVILILSADSAVFVVITSIICKAASSLKSSFDTTTCADLSLITATHSLASFAEISASTSLSSLICAVSSSIDFVISF